MVESDEINIKISEDMAVILFDFFERFGDTGRLYFVHPAEYIALMKISGQIDKSTSAMFSPNYGEILKAARERVAGDFESDFPVIEKE